MADLLVAEQVRKEFGGLVATNDIDFTIPQGSIVSLIGPNGAGKTTFFNMLTGVYKPTAGRIVFDGVDVSDKPPHAITALGVGRTFQNIRLFQHMTALENVLVGMHCRMRGGIFGSILRTPRVRREERDATKRGRELLTYSGLPGRHNEMARNLPYGDQRRLEVARALATKPKLLLLDEPTAGMNPQETAAFTTFVARSATSRPDRADDRARHEGRDGHLRPRHRPRLRPEDRRGDAAGGPEGRARDRGLPRQGSDLSWLSSGNGAGVVLELDDVHTYYGSIHALKGISLKVHDGEVVTLIGANGAGKSTTLRSINGVNHPREGRITFQGKDITNAPPHEVVKMGISQSPEGRRLFPRMTVLENLEMGAFQRNDKQNFQEDIDRVFGLFPRLAERRQQKAGTMSGGEQQMVAMGRALMARPKLLLLDEPSMGLAPIFVEKIFEIVAEINAQGTPILLVEQNALMALDAASRGYVMETGAVELVHGGRVRGRRRGRRPAGVRLPAAGVVAHADDPDRGGDSLPPRAVELQGGRSQRRLPVV